MNPKGEVKKAREPIHVKVSAAIVRDFAFPVHASGKLSSKSEVKLSFKTGGIISNIYVEEGQNVLEGKRMAQLDLSEIQATANQANLGLNKAERDLERIENLYRDSVATLEQYENARTAFEVAANQARIAEFNLKYSTITAPSNGKVLKRIVEENEIIAPGYPVFMFAASENDWVLKANLTDKDLVRVNLRDSAYISFDPFPDTRFTACVSEIGSVSDPFTGTYEVELTLDKTGVSFASGFIGKADIIPSGRQFYISIPVDAMVEADELNGYVYVVENEKPVRKRIEIGGFWEHEILVKSGLDSGMMVITEGAGFVRPDSEIRIVEGEVRSDQ
ncbi:MAG: efflux RND transporter periplasmic adaptor subunit [Bacteroidales bacterium]|nr:MAG: efflux RND transporter periplasmic adaptor subunit [Bacteroidales bacterium]